MKNRRALFCTLALLLPSLGGALAGAPVPCYSLVDLDERIISCGSNDIVPKAARACEDELERQRRAISERLHATSSKIDTARTSGQMEAQTQAGLVESVAEIDTLIASMESRADRAADYELHMINYPDAKTLEQSPACFTVPFKELGKAVARMDQQVIDAKAARAKVVALAVRAGVKKERFADKIRTRR